MTKYRKDSVALAAHIHNLKENPIEFRGTMCDTCHQPLSMPALFFLCQHCYHQEYDAIIIKCAQIKILFFLSCVRGYSENDKECCPVCHSKNLQLKDALHAQSESRDQHEAFHNLLDRSTEPFSVVSESFGRGLFNMIVIVDEDEINDVLMA